MQVSEVTAAATRHEYFFANLVRSLEYQDATATISCRDSAHKSGGAAPQNNDIEIFHGGNIAGAAALQREIR